MNQDESKQANRSELLNLFCLRVHEEQGSTRGNPIIVIPYINHR